MTSASLAEPAEHGSGARAPLARKRTVARWIVAILVFFLMMGFGFGTWLSRLPGLRDELGASTVQMSIYGLCLAAGSLAGMLVAGPVIERLGPRRMMGVMVAVQIAALPGAIALMTGGLLPFGLAVLFAYGFCFSSTDIAMNVSGANAERALGKPRMSLLHAFYSIGVVSAMGLGALAESLGAPLALHYLVVAAIIGASCFGVLRLVPRDEAALRSGRSVGGGAGTGDGIDAGGGADADAGAGAEGGTDGGDGGDGGDGVRASCGDGSVPNGAKASADLGPGAEVLDATGPVPVIASTAGPLTTTTGSVPIVAPNAFEAEAFAAAIESEHRSEGPRPGADDSGESGASGSGPNPVPPRGRPRSSSARYTPWRDPRVLLIGLITLSAGLVEGAPADWLPLALVDGRGVSNEFGAVVLGIFYIAVVSARLAGSALLERFGRVAVVRVSLAIAAAAILIVTLIDHPAAMVLGAIAWGLGTGVCWPVTISAAADHQATASRDVAAVSAIGYAAMLLGPMAFGVLGEHFGLLRAFWLLLVFAVLGFALASVLREPEREPRAGARVG